MKACQSWYGSQTKPFIPVGLTVNEKNFIFENNSLKKIILKSIIPGWHMTDKKMWDSLFADMKEIWVVWTEDQTATTLS